MLVFAVGALKKKQLYELPRYIELFVFNHQQGVTCNTIINHIMLGNQNISTQLELLIENTCVHVRGKTQSIIRQARRTSSPIILLYKNHFLWMYIDTYAELSNQFWFAYTIISPANNVAVIRPLLRPVDKHRSGMCACPAY